MEVPCIRQRIDCCAHRSDDGCVSLEYVNKGGTVETGAQINVPLFVEIGDKIQIDTRTGEYLKRV